MQRKEVNKIVNLNSMIYRYMIMYGGYITIEKTMMYNFVELYKVYTLTFGDYDFSLLIVDNRYRFIDYKGNYYDTDDFENFQTAFKIRLWRVYGDI